MPVPDIRLSNLVSATAIRSVYNCPRSWRLRCQRAIDMPAFLIESACMKAKAATVQYTLRQIPTGLDEALRSKSRREGKSLNQTALEVMKAGLALNGESIVHRDLNFMVGSWIE